MDPIDSNRNSSEQQRSYFQTDFARPGIKTLPQKPLQYGLMLAGILLLAFFAWHFVIQPKTAHSTVSAEKIQLAATTNSDTVVKKLAIAPKSSTSIESAPTQSSPQSATSSDNKRPEASSGNDADKSTMEHYTVRNGDNLSLIFQRLKLSLADLDQIVKHSDDTKELKYLRPGQSLYVTRENNDSRKLTRLVYERSPKTQLIINREGNGFKAIKKIHETEAVIHYASGRIKDSLFLAGMDAGLDDKLVMELSALFGWDIDFALDIRPGDSFSVMYEEHYLHGKKISSGPIIAAEFINRGKRFQAIRYTQSNGRTDYFTPEGLSLRKAFIRTPVNFTRISSRFSLGRKHPILHRIRAHRGVDYAAPRGTPVKASGDGKIVHVGRKGGYGKTIIIKHGQRYQTLYAHLNGYAKSARKGRRVRQGQIIGYVGSTGLATGPHLHYEFHVHGRHRDPLRVKLPKAKPIAEQDQADYLIKVRKVMAEMRAHQGTQLAVSGTASAAEDQVSATN